MTISSGQPGTVFDACLEEGIRQSHDLIRGWCSSLAERLYERSKTQNDPAQRRTLQNAAGALKENRAFIEASFGKQLEAAVREDIRQAAVRLPGSPERSFSALSFDQLELMGHKQVQEAVEGARLQQDIKRASQAGLAGFSARLSTAQGFDRVKADKNPLRPEVVSQALLALLQATPVASHTRACWLGIGAQLMGDELHSLYVSLDRMLADQDVLPAPYGVLAAARGNGEKSSGPATGLVVEPPKTAPFISLPDHNKLLVGEVRLGQSVRRVLT